MAKKKKSKITKKSPSSTRAKKRKVVRVATPEIVEYPVSRESQKNVGQKSRSKITNDIKPVSPTAQNLPAVAESAGALTAQDPLVAYLSEVRRYPLLSPEEEHELALRYHEQGDKTAAERLVTSNLRFVIKIAAEYSKFGAKMIDLIQEGNVGLMHAVKEFNPYKNVRLITYAVWWIRGYIREYLMRQHSMVRVGTTQAQKKLFYNLQKEQRELESAGKVADLAALSERLGVSESDVEEMQKRMSGRDVSLDTPFDEDSGANLLSTRADETAESPEEALMQSEQSAQLKEKIDLIIPRLNEKEKYILEARLLADEPITLQEVGDKFGITRERARQLEARVIDKIRKEFTELAVTK